MSRKGVLYEMSKGSKKIPMKWTAPETIAAYMYTPKTDVFSFSILLWEIFSDGAEPYKGKTAIEVRRMVGGILQRSFTQLVRRSYTKLIVGGVETPTTYLDVRGFWEEFTDRLYL